MKDGAPLCAVDAPGWSSLGYMFLLHPLYVQFTRVYIFPLRWRDLLSHCSHRCRQPPLDDILLPDIYDAGPMRPASNLQTS